MRFFRETYYYREPEKWIRHARPGAHMAPWPRQRKNYIRPRSKPKTCSLFLDKCEYSVAPDSKIHWSQTSRKFIGPRRKRKSISSWQRRKSIGPSQSWKSSGSRQPKIYVSQISVRSKIYWSQTEAENPLVPDIWFLNFCISICISDFRALEKSSREVG